MWLLRMKTEHSWIPRSQMLPSPWQPCHRHQLEMAKLRPWPRVWQMHLLWWASSCLDWNYNLVGPPVLRCFQTPTYYNLFLKTHRFPDHPHVIWLCHCNYKRSRAISCQTNFSGTTFCVKILYSWSFIMMISKAYVPDCDRNNHSVASLAPVCSSARTKDWQSPSWAGPICKCCSCVH